MYFNVYPMIKPKRCGIDFFFDFATIEELINQICSFLEERIFFC